MMNQSEKAVYALGMFDGVHLGHQKLIKEAAALAKKANAKCVVYSFSNHPQTLLNGSVSLLTDNGERAALLKAAGADEVILVPFDREMMNTAPDDFLERLEKLYPAAGFVAGFNYTYGKFGKGTAETLLSFGRKRHLPVVILSECVENGATVSSTRIRGLVERGEISQANLLLGRPFTVVGQIESECRAGGNEAASASACYEYRFAPAKDRVVPLNGDFAAETDAHTPVTAVFSEGESAPEVRISSEEPLAVGKAYTISLLSERRSASSNTATE